MEKKRREAEELEQAELQARLDEERELIEESFAWFMEKKRQESDEQREQEELQARMEERRRRESRMLPREFRALFLDKYVDLYIVPFFCRHRPILL